MALCEGGLPYHLRVLCEGVIETIGSLSFDGQMKMPFTAHPKKDPSTGKLYSFGYRVRHPPRTARIDVAIVGCSRQATCFSLCTKTVTLAPVAYRELIFPVRFLLLLLLFLLYTGHEHFRS